MAKVVQAPGPFLALMLEKYRLNPFKLSKDIYLSQSAVRLITIGKTKITTPVAMRLAKYFNTNPEFWLAMQMKWDIIEASKDKALMKVVKGISRVTKGAAGGGEKKSDTAKKAEPVKKPATKKAAAAKKAAAKKPAAKKGAAKRKPAAKKAAAAKKPAARKAVAKKPVARKRAAAKKPVAARKKATGRKPVAAKRKPVRAGRKPVAAKKKPVRAGRKPAARAKTVVRRKRRVKK